MLKAYVKLRVTIHLEDEEENPTSNGDLKDPIVAKARVEADIRRSTFKYPLQASSSGVFPVISRDEAVRMLDALLKGAMAPLGIRPLVGSYKPSLSAAFGGCPETEKPQ